MNHKSAELPGTAHVYAQTAPRHVEMPGPPPDALSLCKHMAFDQEYSSQGPSLQRLRGKTIKQKTTGRDKTGLRGESDKAFTRCFCRAGVTCCTGAQSYLAFQSAMKDLLQGLRAKGGPDSDDTDIGAQLYRLLGTTPALNEARILSEIGILFVEGFETTGHTISWTLMNIATTPGASPGFCNWATLWQAR